MKVGLRECITNSLFKIYNVGPTIGQHWHNIAKCG